MRPRISRPDQPYYGSRQQRFRLYMLVGGLSFVIIGVQMVRDPAFWSAFRAPDPSGKDPAAEKPIDFSPQFDSKELQPDEFRSHPAVQIRKPGEERAAADGLPTDTPPEELDTSIERDWLAPIRDNTLGIRRDEAQAFFAILARARDVPQTQLEQDSAGKADFRVIMVDSDAFRGRLVTIEGDVRRLLPFEAQKNEFGLSRLYEAWIRPDDSPANPYRVVFIAPPENIPEGEEIETPVRVRVTGYFFKRESYASRGGLHTAPLILAKKMKRIRPPVPPGPAPPPPSLGLWVLGGLILVTTAFGITIWRFSIGDQRFRQRHTRRMVSPEPRNGAAPIPDVPFVDPGEMLRQLAEDERRALEVEEQEAEDEDAQASSENDNEAGSETR